MSASPPVVTSLAALTEELPANDVERRDALPAARIAVIGAGFSGALIAIHLLWRCRRGERVYLVERSGRIGPGLAFATGNPNHLLNVRAANMSAFEDEADHFARWLASLPDEERSRAYVPTEAGVFVQRRIYGRYISALINDALLRHGGHENLFIVPDEAVSLRPAADALELGTAGGRAHPVDVAVMAIGNFPPDPATRERYVGNPWSPAALAGLDADAPILLIGTGLTTVDVCLALRSGGFEGPIYALSRRGLLPHRHAPSLAWASLRLDAEDRRSLVTLTRAVRREVRRAAAEGVGWRAVVDALRPHLQLLWQELPAADKQRFLRHLRPWWDIHRHRMAPPVHASLAALRADGSLRVLAGRLVSMTPGPRAMTVVWRPRSSDADQSVAVQRVINCSGPGTDVAALEEPLLRQILADGLARPDPYRLGLATSSTGALVDAAGRASDWLFAVGPITRGTFWETTSVPDIRRQAEQVAVLALATARRHAASRTPRAIVEDDSN